MKEPILVIMAAGMGSRYGGLKQMDSITEEGELIIDFSIYDAIQAGFKKLVLIVKEEHERDFRDIIGNRISDFIEVIYVHQGLDKVPNGYSIPSDRTKPLGTTHAIWCCKEVVDAPFVVLNADDYYGPEAFSYMYKHLCTIQYKQIIEYAMVGYILNNTLTENGSVTRGVCQLEEGYLSEIIERKQIKRINDKIEFLDNDTWVKIEENSLVSMNMWAFTTDIFSQLEEAIKVFLEEELVDDLHKAECLIPTTIGQLIKEKKAKVKVYESYDTWHGVTYKEDKVEVKKALSQLKENGNYPSKLWN